MGRSIESSGFVAHFSHRMVTRKEGDKLKKRWSSLIGLGAVLVGHLVHLFGLPVLIGSAFLSHSGASHAVMNWLLWGATIIFGLRTIARWKWRLIIFRV